MAIDAAVFDIGGVLTTSPVTAIRDYAVRRGADPAVLGPLLGDEDSSWSRWERSDIDTQTFMVEFDAHAARLGAPLQAVGVIEAAFGTQVVRAEMVRVVEHLRGRVKLGCITNNVVRDHGDSRPRALDVHGLFEVVIESALVGLRKPDARIYEMACSRLGVSPESVVFLDDLGVNLKGARALGMTTIKVDHTTGAIDELEAVLGFPLPR